MQRHVVAERLMKHQIAQIVDNSDEETMEGDGSFRILYNRHMSTDTDDVVP